MRLTVLVFALFFSTSIFSQEIHIIPQPASMKVSSGYLTIKEPIGFIYNDDAPTDGGASFFKEYLEKYYNIKEFRTGNTHSYGLPTEIFIDYQKDLKDESYELVVDKKGITIRGNEKGIFYAFQTLIQLLPVPSPKSQLQIPLIAITDHPRFSYRGMHLDVCRHFFDVSFVKKYIDYLALHKLNTFHWHLTEDQGWRIEIKKYPKLTSIGAYRNGTIIGRYPGKGNDGKRYGGYYTQEEIKEVVKYAADRYITIIPEIELPGHSSAAIAAYNELSCFPEEPTVKYFPKQCRWSGDSTGKQVQQTWGVFDDVYCAGKESTFKFLENVMDEVIALFPSKYIHVGGDESPKQNWKRCPNCQKRIKDNNLKDEHELQSYFIQRMEKYLNSKGKTLIGWDEILEGGLAPNAVVMSWRGEDGGIAAAKQKHPVIMSPTNPVYFDYTQTKNEDSVTIGGYNPIEKVYAYEPVPKELNAEEAKYILGAQANVWSEYMTSMSKLEYMIFPRMSALSEVLWSPKEKRNWNDFEKRLPTQFKRYDLWKANYSKAYYDLKTTVIPTEDYNGVIWKIQSKYSKDNCEYCYIHIEKEFTYKKDTLIYDTVQVIDSNSQATIGLKSIAIPKKAGEKNTLRNVPYREDTLAIIKIDESTIVRVWQRFHHTKGKTIEQKFRFNKATGKKITLTNPASNKYPGDGPFTLVNGVQNEKGLASAGEFLGFDGTDCEAIIDLGKETEISIVYAHVLDDKGAWIWPPSLLTVMVSNNGKEFSPVTCSNPQVNNNTINCKFLQLVKARYIKVLIQNQGIIPQGYPGAGSKPWLFVDEIEVN